MPGNIPFIYPAALESRLSRISLSDTGIGRRELDFKELYFILQTDEGKYAFQSHARQMERASKASKQTGSTDNSVPAGSAMSEDRVTDEAVLPDTVGTGALECEDRFHPSSLILEGTPDCPSRIIAIANAGHGKTTLLERIALFYCQRGRHGDLDEVVREAYKLPEALALIPCIIRLRTYSETLSEMNDNPNAYPFFINFAIMDSMRRELEIYEREQCVSPNSSLERWLADRETRERLLLLIDGLDELSHRGRLSLLSSLEQYLEQYPTTRVILTSRVAGLSESGIRPFLERLRFRGRSIMPLTDKGAREYASLWITKTNESSVARELLGQLDRVMSGNRYRFMREMMHAPLDLTVMLMSLSGGNMAPNRFKMFSDILRTRFTSHEPNSSLRESVFTDTMMILSLMAYRMQKRNILSVTPEDIRELSRILGNYSFQSDIIGNGSYEDYIAFFDNLASNSGIIEKELRSTPLGEPQVHYTIPIRSYHEFLTAYAVCHLRFSYSMLRPDPAGILIKHCEDRSWSSIINFAISDLSGQDEESEDLRRLLEHIFTSTSDTERLREIIESDPEISSDTASLLFAGSFNTTRLNEQQREIISACMSQSRYYAYEYALMALYRGSACDEYLDAYSYAAVLSRLIHHKPIISDIIKRLSDKSEKSAIAGAAMTSVLARLAIERSTVSKYGADSGAFAKSRESEELCKAAGEVLVPDNELARLLYERAVSERRLVYLEAMSSLFAVTPEWSELISARLDTELLGAATEVLSGMLPKIAGLFSHGRPPGEFTDVTELFYAFGVLGTALGYRELCSELPDTQVISFTKAVIDTFSSCSLDGRRLDRMSVAYARLLFGGTYDDFLETFTRELYYCLREHCENGDYTIRFIKPPGCCAREKRFCALLKEQLIPLATEFEKSSRQVYNINTEIEAELAIERYFFYRALEQLGFGNAQSQ